MVKQKPARTRLIPWIFVIIWSTGFIAAKYSTPFMSPYFVLFVRFSLACAIFAGVLILTGKSLCSKREAIGQMAVGVLIHAVFLSAVFTAIDQSLPAGLVALVMGLQPITTALIGLIWLQDRLALKQWTGLLLGLFGVWLVVARHAPSTAEIISENTWLIVFGGLLAISTGTVLQKRVGADIHPMVGAFYQYLAATVVLGALAAVSDSFYFVPSWTLFAALIWMVGGLSIIAILLLMFMIRHGEPAAVASYFYLVPPFTAIQAWLLFDETLSLSATIGLAFVMVGVYLTTHSSQPKTR